MDKNTIHDEQVSDRIITVPNIVSCIRLILVPIFLALLLSGEELIATIVFAVAAGTDWVDGQIARKTNSVSKLGQIIDPAIDRILMISGVIGLLLVGHLPLWVVLFIIIRDGILLFGGLYLIKHFKFRIPVIYAGKITTALLLVGFVGLLLNWPLIPGLGMTDLQWLPGFNSADVSWGIWFVYIGLVMSLATFVYYLYTAYRYFRTARKKQDG